MVGVLESTGVELAISSKDVSFVLFYVRCVPSLFDFVNFLCEIIRVVVTHGKVESVLCEIISKCVRNFISMCEIVRICQHVHVSARSYPNLCECSCCCAYWRVIALFVARAGPFEAYLFTLFPNEIPQA